jgi:hypothetical protein
MSVFDFYTNNKSEAYMLEIAKEMIERFGIPYEEAIGRLNDWFKGSDLTDPYDLIYHREAFFGPIISITIMMSIGGIQSGWLAIDIIKIYGMLWLYKERANTDAPVHN